jgi:flagellar biosynthesis protein FliQ
MTQEMVVFLARHSLITGLMVVGPVLLADLIQWMRVFGT